MSEGSAASSNVRDCQLTRQKPAILRVCCAKEVVREECQGELGLLLASTAVLEPTHPGEEEQKRKVVPPDHL